MNGNPTTTAPLGFRSLDNPWRLGILSNVPLANAAASVPKPTEELRSRGTDELQTSKEFQILEQKRMLEFYQHLYNDSVRFAISRASLATR